MGIPISLYLQGVPFGTPSNFDERVSLTFFQKWKKVNMGIPSASDIQLITTNSFVGISLNIVAGNLPSFFHLNIASKPR